MFGNSSWKKPQPQSPGAKSWYANPWTMCTSLLPHHSAMQARLRRRFTWYLASAATSAASSGSSLG